MSILWGVVSTVDSDFGVVGLYLRRSEYFLVLGSIPTIPVGLVWSPQWTVILKWSVHIGGAKCPNCPLDFLITFRE